VEGGYLTTVTNLHSSNHRMLAWNRSRSGQKWHYYQKWHLVPELTLVDREA